MSNFLLFDIGGSKTRIALSDGESFNNPIIYPTPKSYEEGISKFIHTAKELTSDNFVSAIGGIAGPLNKDKSGIINAPNLPDWNEKNIKDDLQNAFKTEVMLENDTAMVGLGEAVYGAGKGFSIVVYITISTGVNGVRIVDQKFDESVYGFEIGKQIVDIQTKKTWEESLDGMGREKNREAEILAAGIHNTLVYWSPEVVIMGGGKMNRIEIDLVIEKTKEVSRVFPELPQIIKSELGDVGGLYGALEIMKGKQY